MKTKWYRSTQERGRALSALLALVLAVGLVLAVPPLDGPALAGELGQEGGTSQTGENGGEGENTPPAGDPTPAPTAPPEGELDLRAGSCSLTLKFPPQGTNVIGSSQEKGGLEEVKNPDTGIVVVDLYKIADAVKLPGRQVYQFEIKSGSPWYSKVKDLINEQPGWTLEETNGLLHFYFAPSADDLKADDPREWSSLVDTLARFCLDKGSSITPVGTGYEFGKPIEGLDPGLYLTVVHGPAGSFAPVIADNGDQYKDKGDPTPAPPYPAWVTEQTIISTIGRLERKNDGTFYTDLSGTAYDDRYLYLFQPQLVSLPGYAVADTTAAVPNNNAAPTGSWTNRVELFTKYGAIRRYVDLQIVKQLPSYLAGEGGATFIYQITAARGGETVYRAVESLSFNGPSAQGQSTRIIVDSIPVGCDITVTELYAGSTYKLTGAWAEVKPNAGGTGGGYTLDLAPTGSSITIPAASVQPGSIQLFVPAQVKNSGLGSIRLDVGSTEVVTFRNELDDTNKGGGAVINRFEGDTEGQWTWTKRVYDPDGNNGQGAWTEQRSNDWKPAAGGN